TLSLSCSARSVSRAACNREFVRTHGCGVARPRWSRRGLAGTRWDASTSVTAAPRSPFSRLVAEPKRFGFDAAMRVLSRSAETGAPWEAVRFRPPRVPADPPADILATEQPVENSPIHITTAVMGLTGISGVMPRPYMEVLTTTLRNRSAALHDFLDMLSHR